MLLLLVFVVCSCRVWLFVFSFFFFKQKTAYEMRISDWSSDVCSSDLLREAADRFGRAPVVVAVLALMLMLAWFAALVVMMGLPWAYTRAFGSDWQTVQPMRSYPVRDRRTCDHRLARKVPEASLHAQPCMEPGTARTSVRWGDRGS